MKRVLSFFLISVALAVAPGPDVLFVLAQSLANGWRAGSFITLGLCTGLVFHVLLAAFGFAAALRRCPRAFEAVTWCGVAYLAYLGILAWREAAVVPVADAALSPSGAPEVAEPLRLYLRGVIMNILNPKVMLFFLALVPRFVVPEKGFVALQFVGLGFVFALSVILVFHIVAFGGGLLASAFLGKSANGMVFLRYFSAVVMFGIAGWIGYLNVRDRRVLKTEEPH